MLKFYNKILEIFFDKPNEPEPEEKDEFTIREYSIHPNQQSTMMNEEQQHYFLPDC